MSDEFENSLETFLAETYELNQVEIIFISADEKQVKKYSAAAQDSHPSEHLWGIRRPGENTQGNAALIYMEPKGHDVQVLVSNTLAKALPLDQVEGLRTLLYKPIKALDYNVKLELWQPAIEKAVFQCVKKLSKGGQPWKY